MTTFNARGVYLRKALHVPILFEDSTNNAELIGNLRSLSGIIFDLNRRKLRQSTRLIFFVAVDVDPSVDLSEAALADHLSQ